MRRLRCFACACDRRFEYTVCCLALQLQEVYAPRQVESKRLTGAWIDDDAMRGIRTGAAGARGELVERVFRVNAAVRKRQQIVGADDCAAREATDDQRACATGHWNAADEWLECCRARGAGAIRRAGSRFVSAGAASGMIDIVMTHAHQC